MAHFIKSNSGWINLDRVVGIGYRWGDKQSAYVFYAPDGKIIDEKTDRNNFDPELATAPIVPATPGQMAVVISPTADDLDERPKRTFITRQPIVAWRIVRGDDASPVLLQTPSDNDRVFIMLANGELLDSDDVEPYPNANKAAADVLKTAQCIWDDDHPPAGGAV
jgi:hypothetical protein